MPKLQGVLQSINGQMVKWSIRFTKAINKELWWKFYDLNSHNGNVQSAFIKGVERTKAVVCVLLMIIQETLKYA